MIPVSAKSEPGMYKFTPSILQIGWNVIFFFFFGSFKCYLTKNQKARVPSLHYLGYNDIKMAPKKMMEPLFQISSLMHLMVNGAKSEMWGKTHQVWKKKKREREKPWDVLPKCFSLHFRREYSFTTSVKTKTNIWKRSNLSESFKIIFARWPCIYKECHYHIYSMAMAISWQEVGAESQ